MCGEVTRKLIEKTKREIERQREVEHQQDREVLPAPKHDEPATPVKVPERELVPA